MDSKVIETGVDKLVNLVKQRGRIAFSDATKELGVSTSVIQEWVDFLEEEGILSVEYKLTKPFLVERKLTKKEVDAKEKEFSTKKEAFVKKAEISIGFLDKQAEDIKQVKQEFDKIKSELGLELDKVRADLKELEKYQQLRQDLERDLDQQRSDSKFRIEDLTRQISREEKRYMDLVSNIKKETDVIGQQRVQAKSIEDAEKTLASKLNDLKGMIVLIEKRMTDENLSMKNTEDHIDKLEEMMKDVKQKVDEERKYIEPLVQKSKELEYKVHGLQDIILKKLVEKNKDAASVNQITKKVQEFFDKKLATINMVDKLNRDRDDLEKSLLELIKKAKSYEISKNRDMGKDMVELEKKFKEVDIKKGAFESELKKFTSLFK